MAEVPERGSPSKGTPLCRTTCRSFSTSVHCPAVYGNPTLPQPVLEWAGGRIAERYTQQTEPARTRTAAAILAARVSRSLVAVGSLLPTPMWATWGCASSRSVAVGASDVAWPGPKADGFLGRNSRLTKPHEVFKCSPFGPGRPEPYPWSLLWSWRKRAAGHRSPLAERGSGLSQRPGAPGARCPSFRKNPIS